MMMMKEPEVEFIPIDVKELITTASHCTTAETKASLSTCDCTDGEQGNLAGCVGDIV